ncbi:pollen-specific leucine-rich repeat extensin-like protein 3 [Iris pallida]|uniref:Pollen-specific leucine-rich repeat extensin-like protein 3 n=1 Tax=Iris pallida TaxID=29817 RepID=A0AAX6E768_IRIPA|nr:pollen-specific leucine-rich repeat extensin-like protein 3 [Iris pallida]
MRQRCRPVGADAATSGGGGDAIQQKRLNNGGHSRCGIPGRSDGWRPSPAVSSDRSWIRAGRRLEGGCVRLAIVVSRPMSTSGPATASRGGGRSATVARPSTTSRERGR